MFMENQNKPELHNEIITDVLCGNYKLKVYNKAKLLIEIQSKVKINFILSMTHAL